MTKNKLLILISIIFIMIILKTNFFQNFLNLVNLNFQKRISKVYGYCDREGIGYVKFIREKFGKDKKIDLINSLQRNNNNSGAWSIYNTNVDETKPSEYLIIINYNKLDNKINLNNFDILHKFEDCYFLKK
tara:strand:- start:2590 stop:2982 length:393 start_codon:yes stop_codon:yes gene_type:complete